MHEAQAFSKCISQGLLAGYLDIALKIYEESNVLEVVYALINDARDCISLHAANVLATLSGHQKSFYPFHT